MRVQDLLFPNGVATFEAPERELVRASNRVVTQAYMMANPYSNARKAGARGWSEAQQTFRLSEGDRVALPRNSHANTMESVSDASDFNAFRLLITQRHGKQAIDQNTGLLLFNSATTQDGAMVEIEIKAEVSDDFAVNSLACVIARSSNRPNETRLGFYRYRGPQHPDSKGVVAIEDYSGTVSLLAHVHDLSLSHAGRVDPNANILMGNAHRVMTNEPERYADARSEVIGTLTEILTNASVVSGATLKDPFIQMAVDRI